jgi:uncharacterized protein (TIGR01777 family)
VNVVLAGGSGLIGRALVRHFGAAGHEVTVLSRRPLAGGVQWDGEHPGAWQGALDGADVLINLCGAGIADRRWSDARRRELLDSRVKPAEALAAACRAVDRPPATIIQASGVGYYGTSMDRVFDEGSPPGDDFLAQFSVAWENAGGDLPAGTRRIVMRLGVVLSRDGGALGRMVMPFRFFAGGPIAGGQQWFPWIHIKDAVRGIDALAFDSTVQGIVNLVAPRAIRNVDLARAIGKTLGRPALLNVPRFVFSVAFGDMATLLCDGQQVRPKALEEAGFVFDYPSIDMALADLLQ